MIARKNNLLVVSLLVGLSAAFASEKEVALFEILGEVPEGWEVVELSDAPMIEKWVKLRNGEEKKILVKPFGLKPLVTEASSFSVANPLETRAGQDMNEVLAEQNLNLAQSEGELVAMLERLKALLLTLPSSTESK